MKAIFAAPIALALAGLGFFFSKSSKADKRPTGDLSDSDAGKPEEQAETQTQEQEQTQEQQTQTDDSGFQLPPSGPDISPGPISPGPTPTGPISPAPTPPNIPSPPAPMPTPEEVKKLPQFQTGTRTLKLTSPVTKGNDVLALQVMLNGAGASPKLKLDGSYGPGTVKAVKDYQKSRKLTADGVTGKSTWASLMSAVPSAPNAPSKTPSKTPAKTPNVPANLPSFPPGERTIRPATPAMRGTDVLALQLMLNGTGASLQTDGAYGPASVAAAKAYQRSQKMTADGIVGPATWRSLLAQVPKGPSQASQSSSSSSAITPKTPVATPTGLPSVPAGSRTLKVTKPPMRGTDVLNLQVLLNEAGASPQLKLDGSYGPGTVAAVKKYQAAHKLSADGQAGANTWQSLRERGGSAAPAPVTPVQTPASVSTAGLAIIAPGQRTLKLTRPPMSGSDVVAAQTLLNKAGITPALKLDGVYGPGTVANVKAYQKQKGLVADGVLGATTWTSLKRYDTPTAPTLPPKQLPAPNALQLPNIPGLPVFAFGSRVIRSKSPAPKGTDILEMQALINHAGYSPKLVLDGAYGPASLKAARWFQGMKQLTVDGVVGPATWAALRTMAPTATPRAPTQTPAGAQTSQAFVSQQTPKAPAATPALPSIPGLAVHPVGSRTLRMSSPYMKGTDVLQLQGMLNAQGASLTLDGVYGPSGVAAVKTYQTRNKLTADGVVGPATWRVLQGGSVGAVLEDPLREAAMELTAHLKSIGGVDGVGKENQDIVSGYQRMEKMTITGKYAPGDASRILKQGLIPVAPFYWAPDENARNKQRDVFLAQVEKGKQINPQLGHLYDTLREDTIKRLGEVSK